MLGAIVVCVGGRRLGRLGPVLAQEQRTDRRELGEAVVAARERVHHRAEPVEQRAALAVVEVAKLLLGLHREPLAHALGDLGVGRDLALGDLDLVDVLDHPEVADVEPRHQRDRGAGLPRAPGPAGAVHVDLGRLGCRVAEHVGEVADVDAARGDVGGDQDPQLAGLDLAHRGLARGLREVARDLVGVEPAPLQVARHEAHVVLRVAEHDRALGIFVLEDPQQVRFLLLRGGDHVVVLDLLRRARVVVQRHELGVVQEDARQRFHLLRDRRREQARLAARGQVRVDLAHVGPETQREHLIGLVEHEHPHLVEHQPAGAEVVEDPARRADDHLVARVDPLELLRITDTAVDRQAADALRRAERLDLGGDLLGELAGRREHERLTPEGVGVDAGDDRDPERAGLAAAGLRLDDQIGAGAHQRHDTRLDRHRLGPAERRDAAANRFGQRFEHELFGHEGAL